MSEGLSPIDEMLWHIRYWNVGIISRKYAHEIARPITTDIELFWIKTLRETIDPIVVVADSHADIAQFIQHAPQRVKVWNFDQHHDSGYERLRRDEDRINCGNWAYKLSTKIKEYNLIYPNWRRDFEEPRALIEPNNTFYHLYDDFPCFDLIFICRSSPWAPSWADDDWLFLLERLKDDFLLQYAHGIKLDYVLKARPFDVEKANQFKWENFGIKND